MKLVSKKIQAVYDAWCKWCMASNHFVEFEDWVLYTHNGDTLKVIIAAYQKEETKR